MQNNQKKILAGFLVFLGVIGFGVYYGMQKSRSGSSPTISVLVPVAKGSYGYEEATQGGSESDTQAWEYKLDIGTEGGEGPITLTINGFQTMTNIHATGVLSEGSLDVVFDSYGEDNLSTLYGKGDVLFTLTPSGSGLFIQWKKMQPNLMENLRNAFFIKSNID